MLLFAVLCVATAIAVRIWTAHGPKHAIAMNSYGWIIVAFIFIGPVLVCLIIWLATRRFQSRFVKVVATVPIALALAFSATFATWCLLVYRPLWGTAAYDEAIAEAGDARVRACGTFDDTRDADWQALRTPLPAGASSDEVRKKLKLHQEVLQGVTADRAFLQQWRSQVSRIFEARGVSALRAQRYSEDAVSQSDLQEHINLCTELEVTLKERIEKLNTLLKARPQ